MGNIIFEWEVPADYPNFSGFDDIPEAYRVIEDEMAAGGIMIFAKYRGEWSANPYNIRPLVRHLLMRSGRDEIIPKRVSDFLKTKEGKEFFRKISNSTSRQMLYDRRVSFLNPPGNVLRWFSQLREIEKELGK